MDDNNPIQDQQKSHAFVTWSDDSGKRQALSDTSDNIEAYDGIQKATAYNRRSFLDVEPNRSVRTSFTRQDYNRFRSEESVPKQQKEAIKMCMAAYDKVGIIRNVIDLMADFAGQGMVAPSFNFPEHWYQTNVLSKIKLYNSLVGFHFIKKYIKISTP